MVLRTPYSLEGLRLHGVFLSEKRRQDAWEYWDEILCGKEFVCCSSWHLMYALIVCLT